MSAGTTIAPDGLAKVQGRSTAEVRRVRDQSATR
jgi:hypothetical protein